MRQQLLDTTFSQIERFKTLDASEVEICPRCGKKIYIGHGGHGYGVYTVTGSRLLRADLKLRHFPHRCKPAKEDHGLDSQG